MSGRRVVGTCVMAVFLAAVAVPAIASSSSGRDPASARGVSVTGGGGFELSEPGGMGIAVSPRGSGAVAAELRDDIVVRPTASGVESVVRYESRPDKEELRYEVDLAEGVSAVRVIAGTVEFLDQRGTPRLRMAPPYLRGSHQERIVPTVDVDGCTVDRDARFPWGRSMPRPGADSCVVSLRWEADSGTYPAVLVPSWSTTSDMLVPVYDHTVSRLTDGRMVAIGGVDTSSGTPVSSNVVQVYDPQTDTWAAASTIPGDPTTAGRDQHTASMVGNTIVVAGGFNRGWNGPDAPPTPLSSARSYSPAVAVWRDLPSLTTARGGHTADVVSATVEGEVQRYVVAAGGTGADGPLASVERLIPGVDTLAWQAAPPLTQARTRHASAVLTDNRIMYVGGDSGSATGSATTDFYDVESDIGQPGPSMSVPRSGHTATPLIDGSVLVVGGHDASGSALESAEVFDPDAAEGIGQWSAAADPRVARSDQVAAAMPDGTVVVAAGTNGRPLASAERYEPATDTWSRLPQLDSGRVAAELTPYPGSVLVTGGATSTGEAIAEQERLELASSYRTSWLADTTLAEDAAKFPEPIWNAQPYKPHYVQARTNGLWVDPVPGPDGAATMYANTYYDEGHNALNVYRYEPVGRGGVIRKFTSLGYACLPSGDCRNAGGSGGYAVTGDEQYVYVSFFAAKSTPTGNGTCVRRYAKSDLAEDESPQPSPWLNQQGGDPYGDRCFAEAATSGPPESGIRGLATSDWHLFVANRTDNTIQVFNKSDVAKPLSSVAVTDPGQIAFSPDPTGPGGSLWAVVNTTSTPYVQEYRLDGNILVPTSRTLPTDGDQMVPAGLAIDPAGLLAVTDDHRSSQQVRFFDTSEPDIREVVSKRLGEPGGLLGAGGEYGPARLDGPSAVAFDNDGNAYVASLGDARYTPTVKTDIRRFSPSGELDAIMLSNESQNIVTVDPRDPDVVYSSKYEYTLDLNSRVDPGQEWAPERTNTTVDRFACPDDPRVGGGHHAPIAVRYLGNPARKYLYVSTVNSQQLGVYRFDETGSMAKPWFVIGRYQSGVVWVWTDHNGNCQQDSGEVVDGLPANAPGPNWQWSVAENGDLWAAHFYPDGPEEIRHVPLRWDENGKPYYDLEGTEPLRIPSPFGDNDLDGVGEVLAIQYVSATKTLYALGRDHRNKEDLANGYLLARYDNVSPGHEIEDPTWFVPVPDDPDRCTGLPDSKPYIVCVTSSTPSNLIVAGDRVYVANLGQNYPASGSGGRVQAYDTDTGALRTVLVPGKEVGYRTGWLDIRPYSISATQLTDGRRFLYAEDDLSGRILIYRGF